MPPRETPPTGSPCWADLWTSDVEGSCRFYADLFGWEAQEPSPEFGGYFMFTRGGVPVAGGMGDMGDMPAQNVWKIYLQTDDIAKTLETAESEGAEVNAPAMAVADLGTQAVLVDPTGAHLGTWQPGTFPGFTVFEEHGAPGWCELFTRDHARAVAFYRSVFHWETDTVADSDEFRYTTMRNPQGDNDLAGIMDASAWLPDGVPAHWSIYWMVDDVDAAVARTTSLGGSVVAGAENTPYGILATVTDPSGAQFKLRTPPRP
ncbi:MAG TPA: VOC family protein [Acidimicrobiales bacterium]|nr:VOC family protein [Acidimicrobiales bacterium]